MAHKIRTALRAYIESIGIDSKLTPLTPFEYVGLEDFKEEYNKDSTPNKKHFKVFRKQKILCPGCKKEVVYNMGSAVNQDGYTRASYFSHLFLGKCDWNNESDMHLWIKQSIALNGHVIMPVNLYYKGHYFKNVVEDIRLKEVAEEKIGGMYGGSRLKPDICGVVGGQQYWIEVVVTHPCEEKKKTYVRDNEINCIEIIVDTLRYKDSSKEELLNALNKGAFEVKIINHEGLNKEVTALDKASINESLSILRGKIKTINQDVFYSLEQDLTTFIDRCSDTLSESERNKAFLCMDKLKALKFDYIYSYLAKKGTYDSSLQGLTLLLRRYSTEVQKKRAIQYINKHQVSSTPVINIGYYKGKLVTETPKCYQYFLFHERPNGFDACIFSFLDSIKEKPEYVSFDAFNLVKEKRDNSEAFCLADFQNNGGELVTD